MVNVDYGYAVPIACSGGTVTVTVEYGPNSLVVRAHAASGAGSVDSEARSVPVREPIDECGTGKICQPKSAPASAEGNQLVGGGIGLLATAWLLTLRNRREERADSGSDDSE